MKMEIEPYSSNPPIQFEHGVLSVVGDPDLSSIRVTLDNAELKYNSHPDRNKTINGRVVRLVAQNCCMLVDIDLTDSSVKSVVIGGCCAIGQTITPKVKDRIRIVIIYSTNEEMIPDVRASDLRAIRPDSDLCFAKAQINAIRKIINGDEDITSIIDII